MRFRIWMIAFFALMLAGFCALFIGLQPVQATLGGVEYKYWPYTSNGAGGSVDFTGTNGLVWTQPVNAGVLPPNVLTFRYAITPMPSIQYPSSGQMHLNIAAYNGTLSGNFQNSFIAVRIPEGKVANATTVIPVKWTTNTAIGDWQEAYCYIVEWQPWITCRRRGVGAANDWPATTSFRFDLNVVLEVIDPVDAHG